MVKYTYISGTLAFRSQSVGIKFNILYLSVTCQLIKYGVVAILFHKYGLNDAPADNIL